MNKSFDEILNNRNSQRSFIEKKIPSSEIREILQAGIKAPSGKNLQTWRFITIQEDKSLLERIANRTIYYNFVSKADTLIAVYCDMNHSYNYTKDMQSIGACIQNMLLKAESLSIGSCWIGEILSKEKEVNALLNTKKNLQLMAIIALGYYNEKTPQPMKKSIDDVLLHSH